MVMGKTCLSQVKKKIYKLKKKIRVQKCLKCKYVLGMAECKMFWDSTVFAQLYMQLMLFLHPSFII